MNRTVATTTAERGVRAKGKARAADIVGAARELLAGTGEEPFTLRSVAEQAGVRLSHLQYYFPTKGDLVRALLESVAADYATRSADALAQVPDTPTARFMAMIDFLLLDCWDPRVRHFFIRLWGLVESEDAFSGRLLSEFYAADIAGIAEVLRNLSPHLSDALLDQRATIIAGVIEGVMLMIGSGPVESSARQALFAETRKQIFRIATEP